MLEEILDINSRTKHFIFKDEESVFDEDLEYIEAEEISVDSAVFFNVLRDVWDSGKGVGPFPVKQNGGKVIFMFGWKLDDEVLELINDPQNIQM